MHQQSLYAYTNNIIPNRNEYLVGIYYLHYNIRSICILHILLGENKYNKRQNAMLYNTIDDWMTVRQLRDAAENENGWQVANWLNRQWF